MPYTRFRLNGIFLFGGSANFNYFPIFCNALNFALWKKPNFS